MNISSGSSVVVIFSFLAYALMLMCMLGECADWGSGRRGTVPFAGGQQCAVMLELTGEHRHRA